MKTYLVLFLLFLTISVEACNCLDGEEIIFKYFFNKDGRNERIVTLKIKGKTEILGKNYRPLFWTFEHPKMDSLIGYMRMDSSCKKMYYFNISERREDLIYNLEANEYSEFRIRFQDGMRREFYMYYSVKQIEQNHGLTNIELQGPRLAREDTGNLKFIEGIGPNCLYFLEPNSINTIILGFNGILVSKIVDGKEIYSLDPSLLYRHSLRSFIVDTEIISHEEAYEYGDLADLEYDDILKSIKSSKDIYLILKYMDWDGKLELVSKLVDHPLCDKGAAMLAFWYNVPNMYIENGYRKSEWTDFGYIVNLKLYTRLYTNYYKNEENYFKPNNAKYADFEDIMKIPLEFKLPVRGVRYELEIN